MKTVIKTGSIEEFFQRGKTLASLADSGKTLDQGCIISFEDADDLAKVVTVAKMSLFREIRERPGSITEVSTRLHRDRSAVKRDIDFLQMAGLIEVEDKPLPGHGRKKEVRVVADQVLLAL
jgi:predicted transcriptional regulator